MLSLLGGYLFLFPLQNSFSNSHLLLRQSSNLILITHIHDIQRLFHHSLLNHIIKRSIRRKTRGVVNLNQPRLQLAIDHHVEPKDLKAHRPRKVIWLRRAIVLHESWLSRADSFDDELLDFLPHERGVMAVFFEVVEDEFYVSFVADVHGVFAGVEDELLGEFVDGVVGEVHCEVLYVRLRNRFIF